MNNPTNATYYYTQTYRPRPTNEHLHTSNPTSLQHHIPPTIPYIPYPTLNLNTTHSCAMKIKNTTWLHLKLKPSTERKSALPPTNTCNIGRLPKQQKRLKRDRPKYVETNTPECPKYVSEGQKHMIETCHTYGRVTSHIWMPRCTNKCVTTYTWMCNVTRMDESWTAPARPAPPLTSLCVCMCACVRVISITGWQQLLGSLKY